MKLASRNNWLILVTAAIALFTMMASKVECKEPKQRSLMSKNQGRSSAGLKLSVHLEKETFANGEPILASLLTRNSGSRIRTVMVADPEKVYSFVVKDEKGLSVPLTQYGEKVQKSLEDSLGRGFIKLKPGQVAQSTIQIDKLYKMNVPGAYYITAKRSIFRQDDKGVIEVVSNTVKVTVGP
jgi:hypothetical protein